MSNKMEEKADRAVCPDPRVGLFKRRNRKYVKHFRESAVEMLGDSSRLEEYLHRERFKYLKSQWKKSVAHELKKSLKSKYRRSLESKLQSAHSDAHKKHLKPMFTDYLESKFQSKLRTKLKANPFPGYNASIQSSQFDVNKLENFLFPPQLAQRLKFSVENEVQIRQKTDLKCAQTALAHYNEANGVQYELVEVLGSISAKLVGRWYHCNFRAKLVDGSAGDDSSSKLFFAELHYFSPAITIKCCILDESDVVFGCELCPSQMAHPRSRFEKGLPGTVPERCIWKKTRGREQNI